MKKDCSGRRSLFQKLHNIESLTAFYIVAGLYFVSDGALSVVVPVYFVQLGLSYSEIGGMFGAFGLGMAVVKIVVGRHSDLIGRKSYLVIALFLSACLKLLFLFATTPLQFAIILGLDGLSRGFYSTVRAPLITELCTPERRGAAFGWISGTSIFGASVGALGGGLLYSAGERWLVFLLLGLILLAGAMISLLLIPGAPIGASSRPICHWRELIQVPVAIWVLCLINLLQNIVTPPIWDMLVPIYLTSSLAYISHLNN